MEDRLTEAQLAARLENAAAKVSVGEKYRHYKGGEYEVVDLAIEESSGEPVVVYKPLYGQGLSFTRRVDVWCEQVDGQQRFALL